MDNVWWIGCDGMASGDSIVELALALRRLETRKQIAELFAEHWDHGWWCNGRDEMTGAIDSVCDVDKFDYDMADRVIALLEENDEP